MKAAFFSNAPEHINSVFGKGRRDEVAELCDLVPGVITKDNFHERRDELAGVDVIFSTWGMWSPSDEEFDAMKSLKSLYYAAGATDGFARAFFNHGVAVHSAWLANAIPVAEFCLAQILLSMKGYFADLRMYHSPEAFRKNIGPGNYGETVALIGAGAISQKLQEFLKPFTLNVVVIPSRPERRTVSIEEAFRTAFVVSNHLPNRLDNQHVLREEHFLSMRPNACFINTGRGAQVDEPGLISALKKRPDLTALLDVTAAEPPVATSELYTLPNVHLTGHIAGSYHDEVLRMADYMIADYKRVQAGEKPLYQIDETMLMTH